MGFFNKIFVQENKTGNLIDITNLDEKHYESFLDTMQELQAAYIVAKNVVNPPKPNDALKKAFEDYKEFEKETTIED